MLNLILGTDIFSSFSCSAQETVLLLTYTHFFMKDLLILCPEISYDIRANIPHRNKKGGSSKYEEDSFSKNRGSHSHYGNFAVAGQSMYQLCRRGWLLPARTSAYQ